MRRVIALSLVFSVCISLLVTGLAAASMESSASNAAAQAKNKHPDSGPGGAFQRGVPAGRGDPAAHPRTPHLTRRAHSPQAGHSSTAQKKSVLIPQGAARTSSITDASTQTLESGAPTPKAPTFGGSFVGTNECCSIPPDPTMAAGPFQVVIATNDGYAAFDKNGTAVPNTVSQPCAGSCSLGSFFTNAQAGTNIFDPWLVFDEYIGRYWFLVSSVSDSPQISDFLIGLSNTSDVTDGWSLFRIDSRTNGNDVQSQWCDYEKLGIDAQAIYLTCNMFDFPTTSGGFDYAKIRVLTKSQFTGGGCCFWWDWWNLREGFAGVYTSFSIQPAHMIGATNGNGMFLINAFNTCVFCPPDELRVRQITNAQVCCTPGDQHEPDMDEESVTVGEMPDPPDASQKNTSTGIDTGDHRLLYAFWKGGQLSTGQTIECQDTNDACVAYTQLDVSDVGDIGVTADWAMGNDGSDRYYPRVDVNNSGNKTMVYSRSSSSEFAGSFYVGIPSGCPGCTDGPETTLQSGGNSYVDFGSPPGPDNRWGDYMGGAPDPDGTGIWIHSEFAQTTANQWSTEVGLTYEAQDKSAPTTTAALSPVPTAFGWNNTNVLVTLSATDSGSAGVRRITYSASGAQTIGTTVVNGASASFTISAQGTTTVSFFAQDNWGNVESTKTQIVRIDKVAPVVSCGTADGLWHANDVSIACTASDALSGLANLADVSFSLSTSVPAETETNNACTGTHNVLDRASNSTTAGPVCGNMIDKKAPTISIATPTSGAIYLLNQVVNASYTCADGGSGVASCAGPVANGAPIDTASVGNKTFVVNAVDNVGNARSLSVPYIVTYNICLLYDPNKAFAGNSVPLRLDLCDVNGVNVSSPGVTVHAILVNPGGIVPTSTANPTNDFLFNSGFGGYTYVLDTHGYLPGSYTLLFTVTGDPITHSASFKLK